MTYDHLFFGHEITNPIQNHGNLELKKIGTNKVYALINGSFFGKK
jgi:hypothetical protein